MCALALSLVLLVARIVTRRETVARALGVAVAAGILVWGLTTQIYAARGLNSFAERLYEATPPPVDWVDRITGGEKTLYLGQSIIDKNPIWLLEFWNRSVSLRLEHRRQCAATVVVARSRSGRWDAGP